MSFRRSFLTVGGFTAASRILGYLRDLMIAATFATGPVAEAFFVALRLPNLFRRIFAEGAFQAAFLPLYTSARARSEKEAADFAAQTRNLLLLTLVPFSLLMIAGAAGVMTLLAPGFRARPEVFTEATQLARITFPYLLLMVMTTFYASILQAHQRYALAAAAPIFLNVFLLAALFFLLPSSPFPLSASWPLSAGVTLAWAVTLSGLAQLSLVGGRARRVAAEPLALRASPLTVISGSPLLKLMGPGIIASGGVQLNVLIATIIASLEEGAVSTLYYADRLCQLPLGVIGVGLGTVLLPRLAAAQARGDDKNAQETLEDALAVAFLLALPASCALIIMAPQLVGGLFGWGAFDLHARHHTSLALMGLALGLPAYVVLKVLHPVFFARQDTRTPQRATLIAVAVQIPLAVGLFLLYHPKQLGYLGLALATSAAAWVNCVLVFSAAHAHGLRLPRRIFSQLIRVLIACVAMAGILIFMKSILPMAALGWGALTSLLLICLAGLAGYGLVAYLVGALRFLTSR